MSRDVAIAIGVQKSGNLVRLPGAISGAKAFANWARSAGFDSVIEITDENGTPVDAKMIRDEIDAELAQEDVAKLFVFFAGHGVSLGVDVDYWLLSPSIDGDETDGAVNVVKSLRHARRCGLEHLAVFADHCRTMAGKPQHGVYGRPIFPNGNIAQPTEVDQFYAAQSGDISQEARDNELQTSFGIFTEVLLEALEGRALEAAEIVANGQTNRAVTAKSLRDWIVDAVDEKAASIPNTIQQIPDPRPGSYPPNVLAWLSPAKAATLSIEAAPDGPAPTTVRLLTASTSTGTLEPVAAGHLPLEVPDLAPGTYCKIEVEATLTHKQDSASQGVFRIEHDMTVSVGLVADEVRGGPTGIIEGPSLVQSVIVDATGNVLHTAPTPGLHTVVTSDELTGRTVTSYQVLNANEAPGPAGLLSAEPAAEAEVAGLAETRGRDHFESGVGLTIIGARPGRVAVNPHHDGVFEENGAWHVRGVTETSGSAVIDIDDDRYAAVAMFEGFVGTIVVDERGVSHVAYEPTAGRQFDEGIVESEVARRAMALATVAARRGRFDVIVDDAMAVAGTLRRYKHYNPAYGILAAYAYDLAGRRDQVESLVEYFERYPQTVPFDVAMLAEVDPRSLSVPVAPRYPMLTQGWAYLDPDQVPAVIAQARRTLAPTLWATPTGDAGIALIEAIERGEL